MNRVYRVLRRAYARAAFDGEGAYRYGGRWSSPGTRLGYASQHQSLAMLEYFVHLDKDDPPDDLVLAVAEVPADVSRKRITLARLPALRRQAAAPPGLVRFGDEFVRRGNDCVLIVPSVLAPSECNWLINPAHPHFRRIKVLKTEPLHYDPRMFRSRPQRSGQ